MSDFWEGVEENTDEEQTDQLEQTLTQWSGKEIQSINTNLERLLGNTSSAIDTWAEKSKWWPLGKRRALEGMVETLSLCPQVLDSIQSDVLDFSDSFKEMSTQNAALSQQIEKKRSKELELDGTIKSLQEDLALLSRILKRNADDLQQEKIQIQGLKQDFVILVSDEREDFSKEAVAMEKFSLLIQDILALMEFPEATTKRSLAVGGGFSAGKSSFLNALIGRDVLPTALKASTAFPTYICKAGNTVKAFNTFGGISHLEERDLKTLTHAMSDAYGIEVRQLLKEVWFCSEDFLYDHIKFLDTPGYSRGEENQKDYDAAMLSLSHSEGVIWVVDCERGGINASDFKFLSEAQCHNKPLLVVLNKADLKPKSEINDVLKGCRASLKEKGYEHATVVPFSSNQPTLFPKSNTVLKKFLDSQNTPSDIQTQLKKRLNDILDLYRVHHEQRKGKLGKEMTLLNDILVDMELKGSQKSSIINMEDITSRQTDISKLYSYSVSFPDLLVQYSERFIDAIHSIFSIQTKPSA